MTSVRLRSLFVSVTLRRIFVSLDQNPDRLHRWCTIPETHPRDIFACTTLSSSRKKGLSPCFLGPSSSPYLSLPTRASAHHPFRQSHQPCLLVELIIITMPTLISELTPLQSMWLYENQLTRGDSYEEKWHRFDPAFDTTIFRSKAQKRKLPFEEHSVAKPRRSLSSDEHHRMRSQKPSSHGPRFPHMGEKLTWAQSRENLKVYYDHYGVRACRLTR